ncbi:kelch-like protein 20 isoform X2 [Monodelphis domestica]|uniref:kelch-like protein 20 isoform X2 n=1 Tax=Monodelphis domestica TaxID=13616 RepID=UPI0004435B17|nr:kelch-like protein 20 isoform X2 [Monodelphis domestica]
MGVIKGEQQPATEAPLLQKIQQKAAQVSQQMDLLFAVGGCHLASDVISGVECYDPLSHEWKLLGPSCKHRCGTGIASLNGCIYAVGGYDGTTCLSSVERYDPKVNEWRYDVAPLTESKRGAGVTELGGFLYCVGGHNGLTCLSSVERYNPEENRWCKVAPLTHRRSGLGVAALGGYLYAIGGSDGHSPLRTGGRDEITELCSTERFDPDANEWLPMMPMRSKRNKVSLVGANGYLLAVGGFDGVVHLATVEAFDFEANQWRVFGNMKNRHPGGGVGVLKMII